MLSVVSATAFSQLSDCCFPRLFFHHMPNLNAYSERLCEQIGPRACRISFKLSIHRVAVPFVERASLKLVRIEPHGHTPHLARCLLRLCEERRPVALPTQGLIDPEQIDREPLPREIPNESSADRAVRVADVERERCDRCRSCGGVIERRESGTDAINILPTWRKIQLDT